MCCPMCWCCCSQLLCSGILHQKSIVGTLIEADSIAQYALRAYQGLGSEGPWRSQVWGCTVQHAVSQVLPGPGGVLPHVLVLLPGPGCVLSEVPCLCMSLNRDRDRQLIQPPPLGDRSRSRCTCRSILRTSSRWCWIRAFQRPTKCGRASCIPCTIGAMSTVPLHTCTSFCKACTRGQAPPGPQGMPFPGTTRAPGHAIPWPSGLLLGWPLELPAARSF